VLASATVITGTVPLVWFAGLLGVVGIVLTLLGLFAPQAVLVIGRCDYVSVITGAAQAPSLTKASGPLPATCRCPLYADSSDSQPSSRPPHAAGFSLSPRRPLTHLTRRSLRAARRSAPAAALQRL
jgi:hypothetical protein